MEEYDEPSFNIDHRDTCKMMDNVDNQIFTPIEIKRAGSSKKTTQPASKNNNEQLKSNASEYKTNLSKLPELTKRPSSKIQEVNPNILSNINTFEKKLKQNFEYNIQNLEDSDYEEEFINEPIDTFLDKDQIIKRYTIIQEKLKEKSLQIKQIQKDFDDAKRNHSAFIEMISKDTSIELKDKKLIELARKNQELKIKIEKFKLKEKEYEIKLKEATEAKLDKDEPKEAKTKAKERDSVSQNKEECQSKIDNEDQLNEMKRKLKQSESKIVEYRNKLQNVKEENTKLVLLIKKEIGENLDIDRALKDKTYWKGRGEIIESLKCKIKQLEGQLNIISNANNSNIMAANTSVITGGVSDITTTNIGNITTLTGNSNQVKSFNAIPYHEYKKEKEQMKQEIEKLKEDTLKYASDISRLNSRKSVLEKELKTQRDELTEKIKILVDKSDNDEKLIAALYKELEKRGHKVPNLFTEDSAFNLQQEIQKLRAVIKEKDDYVNKINSMLIPDNERQANQINQKTISQIITRLKELEEENKSLRMNTGDGKIYESLARENARMRIKLKELEDKLCSK